MNPNFYQLSKYTGGEENKIDEEDDEEINNEIFNDDNEEFIEFINNDDARPSMPSR